MISGEQTIEQTSNNRGDRVNTHVEVLDDEHPLAAYQESSQEESEDLLKKLIENIESNPALQNHYIRG